MSRDREQFEIKRRDLINKFKKEFIDSNYHESPIFNKVFHCLLNDQDPYSMIEFLIEYNTGLEYKLIKTMELIPHQIIIAKDPNFDKPIGDLEKEY